jgi:hypothetical protein
LSLLDEPWCFAELMLEASYQMNHEAFARQGVFITRLEYWNLPGPIVVTPAAMLGFWKNGIQGFIWQPMIPVPRGKPLLRPNGRN